VENIRYFGETLLFIDVNAHTVNCFWTHWLPD